MPVESAADRAAFLSPDEFGTAATYTPAGGVAAALTGIFDNPAQSQFSGPGLETSAPTFLVRTDDLPAAAVAGTNTGDRLVIAGQLWIPREFMPDGTGMTVIALRRTAS